MCVFCKLEVFVLSHVHVLGKLEVFVLSRHAESFACFLQVGGVCAFSYAC